MLAVLETMGALIAGPLLSMAFRRGLGLGSVWVGLPFIDASCLFGIASVVVCLGIRLPQPSSATEIGQVNNVEARE